MLWHYDAEDIPPGEYSTGDGTDSTARIWLNPDRNPNMLVVYRDGANRKLTSQLFVNVYMNEFDQFVKHQLKEKYYIRYADDFVILLQDKTKLEDLVPVIQEFLRKRLKLSLHPDKVFIKTISSGVDFLGWVHFPEHRVLRTSTKRRMLARVNEHNLASYLGLCKHGDTYKVRIELLSKIENSKTNVK